MAKKVRFPLEMDNGIEVRDIESLRENFSLQRIMGYFENGKLVIWLRDRYANDMADQIELLNEDDSDLAQKICETLGVSYDESYQENIEEVAERNRKLALLKQYATEPAYLENVDNVAFEQDDVYDLLDEDVDVIYLCGEKFSIPLAVHGKKYIGINSPKVVIDSNEIVDFEARNIILEKVEFDEKYFAIVQEYEQALLKKENEYGEYFEDTYISALLSKDMKNASRNCYETIAKEIVQVHHNIDDGTMEIMSFLSHEIEKLQGHVENDSKELYRTLLHEDLGRMGTKYFEE